MDQRRTREWWRSADGRTRVLIEDREASWFGDFARFRAAGFEVAVCTGPDDRQPSVCPHISGGRCPLWDRADVVLCALSPTESAGSAVLRAARQSHPDTPVVLGTGSLDLPVAVLREALARPAGQRIPR